MDIYKTLLLFALVCALAAFFVMWAKWEEEMVKTREERENYQAALNLHNTAAEAAQFLQSKCDFMETFHERVLEVEIENRMIVERERDALQDRLSAILCPMNDHVWKDSACVKCGRVKDA